MTATIYKIPLPEATTPDERDALGTQLSEQGVLGSDAIVESVSSEAADLTLTGRYAYGRYHSELLATELEELADSTLGAVPLYGENTSRSGYYQIGSAQVEPVHAGGRDIWEWTLSLTNVGTRQSQLQALETSPSHPDPSHPFGNETTALVGIPAAARRVRAVDSTSSPTLRRNPSPTQTVETEFGRVELYDATTLSIDDPVYLYDVPKAETPAVDVRVYDTRGREGKYIDATSGRVRVWQAVYGQDHEFDGDVVLDSGRIRITLDDGSFGAEEWNPDPAADQPGTGLYGDGLYSDGFYGGTRGQWEPVSLPSYDAGDLDTDWQPADIDLTHVGQACVAAQVEFEAVAGTNAGAIYALDIEVERGRDTLEVWPPESASDPIPDDLRALLSPIASKSVVDSGVEKSLVAREEVRR